ncbi:MAG TPA: hypothetical protein VFU47_01545 [Armatimonadota bacterium]|nr:hypothetical protein [Armatimonadota bacterium]
MALDSEAKRRAAAGCHPCMPILPKPSGALGTPFIRAAAQWIYFLGEAVEVISGVGDWSPTAIIRRRRR